MSITDSHSRPHLLLIVMLEIRVDRWLAHIAGLDLNKSLYTRDDIYTYILYI